MELERTDFEKILPIIALMLLFMFLLTPHSWGHIETLGFSEQNYRLIIPLLLLFLPLVVVFLTNERFVFIKLQSTILTIIMILIGVMIGIFLLFMAWIQSEQAVQNSNTIGNGLQNLVFFVLGLYILSKSLADLFRVFRSLSEDTNLYDQRILDWKSDGSINKLLKGEIGGLEDERKTLDLFDKSLRELQEEISVKNNYASQIIKAARFEKISNIENIHIEHLHKELSEHFFWPASTKTMLQEYFRLNNSMYFHEKIYRDIIRELKSSNNSGINSSIILKVIYYLSMPKNKNGQFRETDVSGLIDHFVTNKHVNQRTSSQKFLVKMKIFWLLLDANARLEENSTLTRATFFKGTMLNLEESFDELMENFEGFKDIKKPITEVFYSEVSNKEPVDIGFVDKPENRDLLKSAQRFLDLMDFRKSFMGAEISMGIDQGSYINTKEELISKINETIIGG